MLAHNQAYEVEIEYSCEQSIDWYNPLTWIGSCYGYSLVQAYGDQYLKIPANTPQPVELPLTNEVLNYQAGQFFTPYCERQGSFHLFYSGLNDLIDEFDDQSEENPEIIICCHGLIGGHAVGLQKQPDRKFVFFDCNKAKHIINSKQQLKDWLPGYFDINYANYFYGFSADIVKKEIMPSLPNFLSTCKLGFMRTICTPLGIPGLVNIIGRIGRKLVKMIGTIIDQHETVENNVTDKLPEYGSTSSLVKSNLLRNQSNTSEVDQNPFIKVNSNFNGFIPGQKNHSGSLKGSAPNEQESYLCTAARMGALGRR